VDKWRLAAVFLVVILAGPDAVPRLETVDQIVASIGLKAITETDVLQEYRFETFLERGRLPPNSPDAETFRKVELRLIDQDLLQQQLWSYPGDREPILEKANGEMKAIRSECGTVARFDAALRSLNLSRAQLLSRLEQQQHILMMIDDRFSPAAAVGRQGIEAYYHKTFLPEYKSRYGDDPPPVSQVSEQIQKILVQARINQMLQQWLIQLRKEQHVQMLAE
jgi:hypothetical protein